MIISPHIYIYKPVFTQQLLNKGEEGGLLEQKLLKLLVQLLLFFSFAFSFISYVFVFFCKRCIQCVKAKWRGKGKDGMHLMPIPPPSYHLAQPFNTVLTFSPFLLHIVFSRQDFHERRVTAPMLGFGQGCVWSTFSPLFAYFDSVSEALQPGCSISYEQDLTLFLRDPSFHHL